MSPELLRDDWALVVAAGVALLVVLFLLVQKASVSAPAELRRVRRKLARERSRSHHAPGFESAGSGSPNSTSTENRSAVSTSSV